MFILILFLILLYTIACVFAKYTTFNILNYVNDWLATYCDDTAVFDTNDFAWSQSFRDNYGSIRNEYLQYANNNYVPTYDQINKEISSVDTEKKWKTIYLRAFNKDTDILDQFPITKKLINSTPCTLAFFSILAPHAKLDLHTGIYKGVLRYHLGLIIPTDYEQCYINVDGNKLHWREGGDLIFDDIYPHYVVNNTNQTRVILFLDIKRDFNNTFVNIANDCLLHFVKSNDILNNVISNVNSYNT